MELLIWANPKKKAISNKIFEKTFFWGTLIIIVDYRFFGSKNHAETDEHEKSFVHRCFFAIFLTKFFKKYL